jgi:hypothetical protein
MGEVYRARDTRLDRIVAIKILPTHLSCNPEAKQRFRTRWNRTASNGTLFGPDTRMSAIITAGQTRAIIETAGVWPDGLSRFLLHR